MGWTAARPVGAAVAGLATALLVLAAAPAAADVRPSTAKATVCPGVDVSPGTLGPVAAREALLCLLNWERTSAGQPPLLLNDQLSSAAQAHSDDMVARGYFAHDAPPPTPSRFDERITAAGYLWATAGENIAVGLPSARTVITAWLGSQSHCQSVLSPSFTAVGVGVNVGGIGKFRGPTWTQTLGRSQVEPEPGGISSSCPTTPAQPAPLDPLRRYNHQSFDGNGTNGQGGTQGGLGDPTVVVAVPPPVVAPPAVQAGPPPKPVLAIARLRRSKRTLRLDLTLPVASAKKAKAAKKAKPSSSTKSPSKAKQRSQPLALIADAQTATKTKATTKKKAKKKKAPQMTVRLRVIQKGQKARNFRFRRTAGHTYRLRIQLRRSQHGTLRVQAANQKLQARFR